MLNQLIYADIKANSSGGGGYDENTPPLPPIIPGYDPYYEDGGHDGNNIPIIKDDEFLYGRSGRLTYSSILFVLVRWEFIMSSEENLFPNAIINGEVVCEQHSPDHVVAYNLRKTSGIETIKMSLKNSGEYCKWKSDATCIYRAKLRGISVSKSGTCGGGATFRVSIKASGEISIL